jgi:anti-sigma B factor antagonist
MAEADLLVDTTDRDGWTVVQVAGEVDLYTAPKLKERLGELTTGGHIRLVVDLRGVEFLDSTGLGVLIGALKRCREKGGSLVLAGAREPVRKVLGITGLDRVFTVRETVEDAVSS